MNSPESGLMGKLITGCYEKFEVLNELKLLNSLRAKKDYILDNMIAE